MVVFNSVILDLKIQLIELFVGKMVRKFFKSKNIYQLI